MMKRLLLLVTCITLCLLTNLSLRVPTPVAAQASCQTAKGPGYVIGSGDNLFYLGNAIQFTSQSAGAKFFTISDASSTDFGTNPGYGGTSSLGFSASTPGAAATAISCQDSFWDISFEIAGKGATAGDIITFYFQLPDGSGRQEVASFQVMGDNMSVKVLSLLNGVDFSAIGHNPATIGTVIPYEEDAGNAGKRTRLITIALPMNGSVRDCNQLAVNVRRGSGVGTTTVGIVNLVLTRMGQIQQGLSVTGVPGTYPTGRKCEEVCPKCEVAPVCDLPLCFRDPAVWCLELYQRPSIYSNYAVKIPFVNSGMPIMVYNWGQVDVRLLIALGCGGYERYGNLSAELTAEYVAAQLTFQERVPNFYWAQLPKQKLACHWMPPMAMPGMPAPPPALPFTLSNGKTLDGTASLQDLFDATEWSLRDGTWDDREGIFAIYKQLNHCRD